MLLPVYSAPIFALPCSASWPWPSPPWRTLSPVSLSWSKLRVDQRCNWPLPSRWDDQTSTYWEVELHGTHWRSCYGTPLQTENQSQPGQCHFTTKWMKWSKLTQKTSKNTLYCTATCIKSMTKIWPVKSSEVHVFFCLHERCIILDIQVHGTCGLAYHWKHVAFPFVSRQARKRRWSFGTLLSVLRIDTKKLFGEINVLNHVISNFSIHLISANYNLSSLCEILQWRNLELFFLSRPFWHCNANSSFFPPKNQSTLQHSNIFYWGLGQTGGVAKVPGPVGPGQGHLVEADGVTRSQNHPQGTGHLEQQDTDGHK